MLTLEKLKICAKLIDNYGLININDVNHYNKTIDIYHRPQKIITSITNHAKISLFYKDRSMPQFILDNIQFGSVHEVKIKKRLLGFRWETGNEKDIMMILQSTHPYLIKQKIYAEIIIEFIQRKETHPNQTRSYRITLERIRSGTEKWYGAVKQPACFEGPFLETEDLPTSRYQL